MNSASLRDQLKALGLAKAKPEPVAEAVRDKSATRVQKRSPPLAKTPSPSAPRTPQEIDAEISLAKAYAARQAAEQAEAAALRRQQEEKARLKRERKAAAIKLLEGQSLTKPDAELPRHFEYGRKIRRIYVDAEQLRALNQGQLGVAQLDGKFLLVEGRIIDQLQQIAPEFVALRVDPQATAVDELPVPDDLHW